jgi:hypothetical protein
VRSRWRSNKDGRVVTVLRVDGRRVYVADANGRARAKPLDHLWFDPSMTGQKYYRPA